MADADSSQVRAPPLTQSDAVTSLLSLSLAAAAAANDSQASSMPFGGDATLSGSIQTSSSSLDSRLLSSSIGSTTGATSTGSAGAKHHRRLSSTGRTRRRFSDAREASARPILLSIASLSLSTSPAASKPLAPRPASQSPPDISVGVGGPPNSGTAREITLEYNKNGSEIVPHTEAATTANESGISTPIPISSNGKQKKRGMDYKCESCSKIYRHPNCLNKHRWEHTRQWREASKFVLSKHQQVQLLEAATILSFMGTTSTSLPEDRSEWPSFLSGGSLPKVEFVSNKSIPTPPFLSHINSNPNNNTIATGVDATAEGPTTSYAYPRPISLSTSVPARMSSISTRSSLSAGPRMHDFLLPPGLGTSNSATASANFNIGVVAGPNGGEQNAYSSSAGAVPFRFPSPDLSSGLGMKQAWTSAIPSSSARSGSSTSGSGSESRSRSGSGSGSGLGLDWKVGSRSRSGSFELDVPVDADDVIDVELADKGDFEVGVEVVDTARTYTNVDINADDNGDDRHAAAAFVEPVRASFPASVGAYPYGPPFHNHEYGHGQRQGAYGSYGSYGAAQSYGAGSSSSTTGAATGRPGSFGGYSDARSFDAVRDTATGGFATRARAKSDARRDMGFVKLEEEDEGEEMGMDMRDEEEIKAGTGRRRSRKMSELEAEREKWDGMEMEVDMDMD